jgi:TfoX/Sxy family transcriptional regulator of competence genes
MSYDKGLAERVHDVLPMDTEERRMFGGVAFMVRGNLCVGVMGEGLLVRVGKEAASDLVNLPGARTMTMGKRTMAGWVYVQPESLAEDAELAAWIKRGLDFVASLPPR